MVVTMEKLNILYILTFDQIIRSMESVTGQGRLYIVKLMENRVLAIGPYYFCYESD